MNAKDFFLHGLFSPHSGDRKTLQTQLHWTLRVTVALCFIGHGTWGLITKSGWLPFFASQGIEPELAWTLQPLIGAFDIIMALLLLRKSNRAILIWMFLWALWTAMLRPLAGNLDKPVEVTEGQWVVEIREEARPDKTQTWEFWERAGNWGLLHAFDHGRSLCVKQEGLARRLRGTGDHRLYDRHHFLSLQALPCLASHRSCGFRIRRSETDADRPLAIDRSEGRRDLHFSDRLCRTRPRAY